MSTVPIQERLDRQLLNACRYGHVSEVDILLSKGANIQYSDEDDPFGATCLSEASRRGKSEIVQLLIDRGVSVNDKISHDITSLHLACERGHISVVSVLLNNKCDPCPSELFNLDTPLHYAAANDHDKICKLLVETGNVNVNIQNRTGDTPLHIAVANDRLKSTTMLLALNGDLSITNHAEMTPIIVAQIAKCKQAIEAMQPFINKIKCQQEIEEKKQQQKIVQSRKNTIKKTLDGGLDETHKNSSYHFNAEYNQIGDDALEEDIKYNQNDEYADIVNNNHSNPSHHHLMSGKRDVVFKKGFLSKQGKKFKHFHERYFILWSNGLMNYYSKEHTVFSNYTEKSKSAINNNKNSDSNDNISNEHEMRLKMPKNSKTSGIDEDQQMAFEESGDETPDNKKKKGSGHGPKIKRKSTLHKLGLKSDTIKPKGIIDINDLIETQFLEFTDNSCGWALITPEREWKFKCKTDRERREWIAAVHAVNYGISPFDFQNLGMNISYKHNTMLLEPSSNSFIKQTSSAMDETTNAVAQGWMYKLGAAVRGLEQNYWKKRWVSLYKKPARLAYAQHPYSLSQTELNYKSSIIPITNGGNDNNDNDDDIKQQHDEIIKDTLSTPTSSKRKKSKSSVLKGVIELNDVTNIIKIGNNDIIKNKYRSPTVHVFALITDRRTWVFACKTAEECAMWHDRIAFFLPNQWKHNNNTVNVEDILKFNRVKTMAHEHDKNHSDDDSDDDGGDDKNHLNVNKKKKNKKKDKDSDDTVMSKIFRKVSNVAETLGITEQYSTISGVQPKGTITDYDDAVNIINQELNNDDKQ